MPSAWCAAQEAQGCGPQGPPASSVAVSTQDYLFSAAFAGLNILQIRGRCPDQRPNDGKSLDEPFDGYHSARRGTYRIIYRTNEDEHTVEIHSIRHRRDSYRT
jgi:mRNA-degrading endonuclease RelE of RelBE toxin-antitoxin system